MGDCPAQHGFETNSLDPTLNLSYSPIMIRICSQTLLCMLISAAVLACGDDGGGGGDVDAAIVSDAATEDLDVVAEDFTCILQWTKAQSFYVTNKLGYQTEAENVANSPTGGTFPVGTIIQLVPTEAMVKRRAGWNPTTNDWEFLFLEVDADGTNIVSRGTDDVVNGFGGNCFDCHKLAEPQWDLVCGADHGCDPIPVTPEQIEAIQMADPRCMP